VKRAISVLVRLVVLILIISVKDDFHALVVQRVLAGRGYTCCHILECDRIFADHRISWSASRERTSGILQVGDTKVDVADVSVIWWRRVRADQQLDKNTAVSPSLSLINHDCRGALSGVLEADFAGTWVSSPAATERASNKVYQLAVARSCGFRIPETLVSQSLSEVRHFTERHNGNVIVKAVVGTKDALLATQFLGDPTRLAGDSYQICPAVYQEYIPGTKHIRLNCFGERSFAATIETSELDWRPNLNVPVHAWEVPATLHKQVRAVLDQLGLAMGVIDLKWTPDGEFVWLEVNPQGQFLFLEPLTRMPLSVIFSEYLLSLDAAASCAK
jgi:hypothetical protein